MAGERHEVSAVQLRRLYSTVAREGLAQRRVAEDELLRLELERADRLRHGWGREARHLLGPQPPQQQHRRDRVEAGGRLAQPTRRAGGVLQHHEQLLLPLPVPVQHALAHGLRRVPLRLAPAGRLLLRRRRLWWLRRWHRWLRRWHQWLLRPPQRRRRLR